MSFDLSSTGSDDSNDSSVVDISTLLPGGNISNSENDDNKNINNKITSLLGDASSHFNNEDKTNDQINNYEDSDRGSDSDSRSRNQRKQTNTIDTTTTTTKQSPLMPTTKETKGYGSSNINCDDHNTIRVVMGESVKTWRRQRNNAHSNDDTKPYAKHQRYVAVQQRDASSDRTTINKNNCASSKIDFQNSHLNVQSSGGDNNNNDRAEIVVTASSTTRDNTESINQKRTQTYTTKKCKRQLLSRHDENQTVSSSSSTAAPLSTSTFVDCIAIWDTQRQVYVLEVPELIANDVTIMASSDDDAVVGMKSGPRNKNPKDHHNGIIGNSARLRQQDPLREQQIQAETKLLNQRKRRRL